MSALVAGSSGERLDWDEIAKRIGDLTTVWSRLENRPSEVNTSNCERTLKKAAETVVQLWEEVQAEKARREKAVSRVKRQALAGV
ncbi:hypothetical protein AAJCM20276_26960 [Acetobacter aceti]|uniref:Uncharacterized protein n=1 Tax=Acetobacter aceti TaxID=435 RepID=A0A6S6PTM3_ACEAC|nr:hypothetical protein [Acetobacter aceti]BCI68072.1 hypothetical protein AAJCM20276_26960 [Acetobacter aceti]